MFTHPPMSNLPSYTMLALLKVGPLSSEEVLKIFQLSVAVSVSYPSGAKSKFTYGNYDFPRHQNHHRWSNFLETFNGCAHLQIIDLVSFPSPLQTLNYSNRLPLVVGVLF